MLQTGRGPSKRTTARSRAHCEPVGQRKSLHHELLSIDVMPIPVLRGPVEAVEGQAAVAPLARKCSQRRCNTPRAAYIQHS